MEAMNMIGNKIGKLTVIESTKNSDNRKLWRCKCDCGNEVFGRTWELKTRRKHSCGCDNPNSFADLTGRRFGKLTVISFGKIKTTKSGYKKYFWKCKCDCGKEKIIGRGHLLEGRILSCGCLHYKSGNGKPLKGYKDIPGPILNRLKQTSIRRKILYNLTPKYLWELFIKQNKICPLSGMNISFDKEEGKSYKVNASLDRIDSSKGYIKGNVQWVHKHINMMKQSHSQSQVIDLCRMVVNRTQL